MAILNSCSRILLFQLMHYLEPVWPPFQLLYFSMVSCHKQFLCPEFLLQVGVMLSYLVQRAGTRTA